MWGVISGHLPLNFPALKQEMLSQRDYDFEAAYHRIMRDKRLTEEEKQGFAQAVIGAFRDMHDLTVYKGKLLSASAMFQFVVSRFAGLRDKDEQGFFFTVNQDLFVETFHRSGSNHRLALPGVRRETWFNGQLAVDLDKVEYWAEVPETINHEDIEQQLMRGLVAPLAYVKLHGSIGFRGPSGGDILILGSENAAAIRRHPLLEWYSKLFNNVLYSGDVTIVVIGYGFQDEHINDVLKTAIVEHRAKLELLAPGNMKDFFYLSKEKLGSSATMKFQHTAGSVTDLYEKASVEPTALGRLLFKRWGIMQYL